MRYFFHLEGDGDIHLDSMGEEFSDTKAAEAHAVAMVRQLARDSLWKGWSVRVIDGNNVQVLLLPITDIALTR